MLSSVAHPLYLRRLLVRAFWLWVLLRLALTAMAVAAKAPLLSPDPRVALLLALAVGILAHVDARVMRERTFLANLGTPDSAGAVIAVAWVLVAETLLALLT